MNLFKINMRFINQKIILNKNIYLKVKLKNKLIKENFFKFLVNKLIKIIININEQNINNIINN